MVSSPWLLDEEDALELEDTNPLAPMAWPFDVPPWTLPFLLTMDHKLLLQNICKLRGRGTAIDSFTMKS